jgi:Phosphotransferase enzyme family
MKTSDVVETIRRDCEAKLDLLSRDLPARYMRSLSKARTELPLLFTSTYPWILCHDDLCEMNILVDLTSGHITGIIDWAEARILPFGFSLWGFENVLGFMDSQGWHYYNNHHELEKLFWQAFEQSVGGVSEADRQAIRVARMAGFFLRYGFVWEDGVRQIPVKESDASLRYLDAFCLADDDTKYQSGQSGITL